MSATSSLPNSIAGRRLWARSVARRMGLFNTSGTVTRIMTSGRTLTSASTDIRNTIAKYSCEIARCIGSLSVPDASKLIEQTASAASALTKPSDALRYVPAPRRSRGSAATTAVRYRASAFCQVGMVTPAARSLSFDSAQY